MAKQTAEFNEWDFRLNVSDKKAKPIMESVKTNLDYYRGKQWNEADSDKYTHLVVENLVFANTRSLVAQLAFKNPKHFITPRKKPDTSFESIAGSMSFEVLLGWYFKEMRTLRESRKCLYDALIGHRGIARLGYTLKTEKFKNGNEINTDEIIIADSPFIKRYSEFDFRHDTEGSDALLDDSRWCAFKFTAPLKDIKDNPRYNARGLKPNAKMITDFGDTGQAGTERPSDDTREAIELVEGWEIYDKKERRVRVIAPGHSKFLRNEIWEKALDNIEGLPVETLYFNENPDEALPVSDVTTYRPMQDELNKIRSMQMDHVDRISRRRYGYNRNKVDDEEMRKITHGGNGVAAGIDGDPTDSIVPIKEATISQDSYVIANLAKQAIRQMAGLSQAEALDPKGADTATEAGLISGAAGGLRSDQQAQYEDFNVRLSRKLAMIIQKTLDKVDIPLDAEQFQQFVAQEKSGNGTHLVKVVGAESAITLQPWLALTKADIQGEFNFDIEMGSTQPINEETRKRDALTLAQALTGNPTIKPVPATLKLLEVFKNVIQDPNSIVMTEEEFGQQQQQQAESVGQSELQERQMKDQTDLQKTKMKTESSERTAKLKSDTELAKTSAEQQTERGKTGAKVFADMVRDGGRPRQ